MKEFPIIFSASMVRAILEGRKTQTRRVVKAPWLTRLVLQRDAVDYAANLTQVSCGCPYGFLGDRLWVRETWWEIPEPSLMDLRDGADTWPEPIGPQEQRVAYVSIGADGDPETVREWGWKRRPSIFMPRWASRITLEIAEVRVQRVQEISEEDCGAEGIDTSVVNPSPRGVAPIYPKQYGSAKDCFRDLWDSINAKRGFPWDSNPWVWAISFKRA